MFLMQARSKALDKITTVTQMLQDALSDLKEVDLAAECLPLLKDLLAVISHVQNYWLAKGKKKNTLFSMAEPSLD